MKDALGIEAVFTFAGVITAGGAAIFVVLMSRSDEEIQAPSR